MEATTKKAGGKRQWSESKAAGKKRPRPDSAAADSTSTSSSSSTNKKPVKGLNHIKGHAAVVATCDSGKEKQATKELLTLLEESASELHPEQAADSTAAAANDAEAADSTSTSTGGASIEELIRAEASAVRAAGTTNRFVSVNSELSGVLIICCMDAAVDIVATVRHICSQIVARRERRTRFLVRLTPLSSTCYGDLHNFSALAAAAVPAAFAALPLSSGVQWAVQLTRRYTGVQRSEAIAMLGKLVPEQHTVHLADPDVVVMAEAVKCIAGLSVVSDYRAHGYGGFHLRALQEAHCGKGLDCKLDAATADDE